MRASKIMTVTDDTLLEARCIAARLVRDCGDAYWPILLRLNREVESRQDRLELLQDCLREPTGPERALRRTL